MGLYGNLATGNYLPYNVYYNKTSSVLFGSIQAFSSDKRFTDLNPSESGERFFLVNCVVLNAKKKQLSYFFKRSHSVQSIPTSATSRDGSLLKPCFFPALDDVAQTSLVFSQTRRGCLRSLLSDQDTKAVHKRAQI